MKKSILISLLILFGIVMVSCNNKNFEVNDKTSILIKENQKIIQESSLEESVRNGDSSNKNDFDTSNRIGYEIIKASYIDKNIKINYPQIVHLGDESKQKKINEIIKDDAYGYLKNYSEEGNNDFDLDLDYHITWKSSNLLSIQYSGYSYDKGAAHPNYEFYTTNIGINKEKTLRLTDLVNINEHFVTQFKGGKLKSSITEQKYILDEYSNQEWISRINNIDSNDSEMYWYLTEDSLGISVQISHSAGDHAEFEIKYQDIQENIKHENEIWKDFAELFSERTI
ncbi:hypothetical protein HNQ80_003345 [Anaerosolibacter carboniphilus]|uniref:Deacetylase PdaC domain-containing protein n=1 Tax=Anaerosolibacter carboniphilus TaxID=1417629 RepID=A0A841KUD2_9FIRM|nr:DUF4163 domain-containing protein [Anaerosolibacter carboniphilus]MBB6217226.1 hypothetical protein [Anaerosolibacter carboniphilus]